MLGAIFDRVLGRSDRPSPPPTTLAAAPTPLTPRRRVELALPNYRCDQGHDPIEGRGDHCWFCGRKI